MIHATALVDPGAELGEDVEIGAYSIVGKDVKLGRGCWMGAHAIVQGPSEFGEGNRIFPFASLGEAPQDLKYGGEPTRLVVGSRNVFREGVTVSRGTVPGGGVTRIGDENLFMAYCHVAHDCKVGSRSIMANSAALAGHVELEDGVVIGGLAGIHQFVRIGTCAIVGAGSMITKDVGPFVSVAGNRDIGVHGLNLIGLKRRGFGESAMRSLKQAYKLLFRSKLIVSHAVERIEAEVKGSPEVDHLVAFIRSSQRGIYR